jgi:chorismate mutase/prephenate dehydratase
LLPQQLKSIYREIISAAIAAEKPMSIAYWGPPGTFTNMAALQTFGSSAAMVAQDSISDVFLARRKYVHCN